MQDQNLYGINHEVVKDRFTIQNILKNYNIKILDNVIKTDPKKYFK